MSGSPKTWSRTFLSAVGASWWATSGWCRSNAGRSERIRGRDTKLCRGGGQEVAHSRDAPYPQGSSTLTIAPVRQVFHTLYRNGSGVWKVSDPPHLVPIQLKNYTPVGTAMSIVVNAKNGSSPCPVTYMWWAHTVTDRAAIAMVANTSPL